MKQMIKNTLAIATLLLASLGAVAQSGYRITINGNEAGSGLTYTAEGGSGTVTPTISGNKCKLTVVPATNYYFKADELKVTKTVDGSQAQARKSNPGVNVPVTVTPDVANADLSTTTTYTFPVESPYGYEITLTFGNRTSLESASVATTPSSYSYNGKVHKPSVTVSLGSKTLTLDKDYTLTYPNDCINGGDKTITITGKSMYSGTASGSFSITRVASSLSFSQAEATYTFGETFTKPVLTTNPTDAVVTYSSDNDDVVVDTKTGDIISITPTYDQVTITATFDGDDNYYGGDASYKLTVENGTAAVATPPTAKENLTYTGEPLALIEGGEATNGTMVYRIDNGKYATAIPTATDAKEYTVYYKARGYTGYDDSEAGSIKVTIAKATPTLTFAPAAATYTFGEAFTKPVLTTVPADIVVAYSSDNDNVVVDTTTGDITSITPTDDQVTITATFAGDDNYNGSSASYTLTVKNGMAAVATPPTAKENLTYTGEPLKLIEEGEATNGTMLYRLDDGDYAADIPAATDAKEYTIYYMAKGNTGFNDSEAGSIKVTIAKATPTLSFSPAAATYTFGETFTKPVLTTVPADIVVTYSSDNDNVVVDTTTGDITSIIPTEDQVTITATFAGDDNYNGASASYTLTVKTGMAAVATPPMVKENLTYTGEPQKLIEEGEATNGTMLYRLDDGEYAADIPTATDAKEYTVYYKAKGYNGYDDSEAGSIKVTIAKATPTLTFAPAAATYTFGEAFTKPVLTTNPADIVVTYSSSDDNVVVDPATGDITNITPTDDLVTITATFAENDNYNGASASYTLTVIDNSEKYDLWIGDTQVTSLNCTDIFHNGDAEQNVAGTFQYVPSLNKLFITNADNANDANLTVTTSNPNGLIVYLAPNSTNAINSIVYTGTEATTLAITTDGNYPGSLSLKSNESVISGFTNLLLTQDLRIINPEDAVYENGELDATEATIAAPLPTITNPTSVMAGSGDLLPGEGDNDLSVVVNYALYTLGDVNNPEGDGYDDTLGCLVLNSTMTDDEVETASKLTPGTKDFLDAFKGITLKVAAGSGTIDIDASSEEGYSLWIKIGDALPVLVGSGEQIVTTIHYAVAEPTYAYIYAKADVKAARGISKGGKKTVVHIKIHDVKVTPSKVNAANPASEASDGAYIDDTSHLLGQNVTGEMPDLPIPGDANGDGIINAGDIVELVNVIMGKQTPTFDWKAADVNKDNVINAADIVEIVKLIMIDVE